MALASRATLSFALLAAACSAPPEEASSAAPPGEAPREEAAAPPAAPAESPAPAPAPATPPAPSAPAGLACLAKHYVGASAAGAGGWVLRLPDGAAHPWDDGESKTFAEKLAAPDLEDTLSIPYAAGPIVPVTAVDFDPGRIRHDPLLRATFGATKQAVQAALVEVDFVGQTVTFHTRAAKALANVSAKLKARIAQTPSLAKYVTGPLGGTFEWRPIANTTRMSAHSYGIAIDIVVSESAYWEWDKQAGDFGWRNRIPEAVVEAFESEGFAWGGRWYHYDTMHFEYRPELFDAGCRP